MKCNSESCCGSCRKIYIFPQWFLPPPIPYYNTDKGVNRSIARFLTGWNGTTFLSRKRNLLQVQLGGQLKVRRMGGQTVTIGAIGEQRRVLRRSQRWKRQRRFSSTSNRTLTWFAKFLYTHWNSYILDLSCWLFYLWYGNIKTKTMFLGLWQPQERDKQVHQINVLETRLTERDHHQIWRRQGCRIEISLWKFTRRGLGCRENTTVCSARSTEGNFHLGEGRLWWSCCGRRSLAAFISDIRTA